MSWQNLLADQNLPYFLLFVNVDLNHYEQLWNRRDKNLIPMEFSLTDSLQRLHLFLSIFITNSPLIKQLSKYISATNNRSIVFSLLRKPLKF